MIAFDSSLNDGTSSYSFTNTAGNFLCIIVATNNSDAVTATYNGVSLTAQGTPQKMDTQNNWIQCLTLMSPATGSNTLAITGGAQIGSSVTTHSGVKTTGQPEVIAQKAQASATSVTQSITTTTDNSWVIAMAGSNEAPSSWTNITARASNTFPYMGDSNAVVTPAGALSQTFTASGSTPWAMIQIAIAPKPAITFDVSDTINIGEAHTEDMDIAVNDSISISENVSFSKVISFLVSDTINIAESFIGSLSIKVSSAISIAESFISSIKVPWVNRVKPTTSFTNRSKPSTSFSERSKPTTNWTNRTKPN